MAFVTVVVDTIDYEAVMAENEGDKGRYDTGITLSPRCECLPTNRRL